MPALLALVSSDVTAGNIVVMHFGWEVQIGSTISNTSSAVVAALTLTGTASGSAGICIVATVLCAPDCAKANPVHAASSHPLVNKT